jgi:hypothetical protein
MMRLSSLINRSGPLAKSFLPLLTLFLILSVNGCGDSKESTKVDNSATTPLNTACLNGTASCNPSQYYQYPGFLPHFPQLTPGYGGTYQWCGCTYGTYPVYHGQLGSGCIQSGYAAPFINSGYFFYIGAGFQAFPYVGHPGRAWMGPLLPPNNQHWVNTPQMPAVGDNYGSSCQQNALYACFVDVPGSCGNTGFTCRPTSGGSRLGVCSR